MGYNIDDLRLLRDKSGAGIMDCKQALVEAKGNVEEAVVILRKKGIKIAEKKSSRETKEGIIDSYIHLGGKIGVLIEVNCESDFVAKNEEFKSFVHDLAMQVAAKKPKYIRREDVNSEDIEKEKEVIKEQFKNKPPQVMEKIVNGKLEDFYQQVCLLDQSFIRDEDIKILDLLKQQIAKFGENITIKKFVRFEVGE
jgi:elongation factor Ts